MVEEEKRRSFPSIPNSNWWDLRNRFKQSVPAKVDPDYIQAVLGVGEGHAKNLIPQLTAVGLIGDDGKPTELAMDWRDDGTYADACERVRGKMYPQGLQDALPPPRPDRSSVEQWFMRNAKVGQAAAGKMASFYLLLCDANPTVVANGSKKPKAPNPAAKKTSEKTGERRRSATNGSARTAAETAQVGSQGPSLHVDVQVHISPDASPDQIDQIFASMAKHIYSRTQ